MLVLLCLVLATPLRADTISGTVKDPSGAVVAGARIELTGGNLSQPLLLTSDESGNVTIFSLENGGDHLICCAPNHPQGWSKFTGSLWMASADGGLAATAYAPCTVNTSVAGIPVRIEEITDYPFRGKISINVDPERSTRFPMHLRVPGWASSADISINGKTYAVSNAGSFTRIERSWTSGDRIEIDIRSEARIVSGINRALTFEDGPLVFALPVDEEWVKLRDRGFTADWQLYSKSPWNYAASAQAKITRGEQAVGDVVDHRRRLEQEEALEDEADPGRPQAGELVV